MPLRPPHPSVFERVRAFVSRPGVKRARLVAQYALLAGIVLLLALRLSEVGWSAVVAALPATPLFYLIFTLRYFALPLAEIPAYELVWRRPLWRFFSAFIRKRVYNFAVMGYSGEAFFTLWARRNLDISDRDIVVGVKDNNLVSALASNIATALLVVLLFWSGRLQEELDALPGAATLFAFAFISASSLAAAVIIFRRKIIHLPRGMMRKLAAIAAARVAFILALQTLLYWSAAPETPLGAWFILIALQLVLTRIPFVPNPDIVFLAAAVHLAPAVHDSEAQIAGMLVAEAALSQLFNIGLFAATAHLALRRRKEGDRPADRGGRRAARR
jgi:hypothetical protein